MALYLTVPPAGEPITLAEAKAHLRIDEATEDIYVQALIVSARVRVEVETRRALITQTWTETLDCWPAEGVIPLQIAPVQAITAITVRNADGAMQAIDSALYALDGANLPPRLVLRAGVPTPASIPAGIAITFTAGYGDDAADVPADIRHAMLLLIASWYEHRDPMLAAPDAAHLPKAVASVLGPYRGVRL